jgi:ATP-dependent helicase YprA (DUF1998 family)
MDHKHREGELSIFDLHQFVIDEYSKYVQTFLSIADDRIRAFIEESFLKNQALWPDTLLQLNPSYEMVSTVKDLVIEGKLHPLCADIFCGDGGESIRLYRHQGEAIEKALNRRHFVVTSGTGSGKTLTYFVPIFDAILRGNPATIRISKNRFADTLMFLVDSHTPSPPAYRQAGSVGEGRGEGQSI